MRLVTYATTAAFRPLGRRSRYSSPLSRAGPYAQLTGRGFGRCELAPRDQNLYVVEISPIGRGFLETLDVAGRLEEDCGTIIWSLSLKESNTRTADRFIRNLSCQSHAAKKHEAWVDSQRPRRSAPPLPRRRNTWCCSSKDPQSSINVSGV